METSAGIICFFVGIFLTQLCAALYDSGSDVVNLSPANFDRLVVQSDSVWIVEFYAPWCGHCQQFVPEYSKAATALKGVVKVGGVNVDEHKGFGGQYGVQGFPTVKIFGADKHKPEDYKGPRTAQGLIDAGFSALRAKVNSQLPGGKKSGGGDQSKSDPKDVIELTDSNFDSLVLDSDDLWLVEFFAPWCGHCKSLAPHWARAATELKGKVKLGALDATVHTSKAQQYDVNSYPTIKLFPSGKKDASSAVDYTGGRTSSDIVNWALDKLAENVPPPEIKQIVSETVLKEACEEHPLCVIAILPYILDCQSKCRSDYLDIMQKLGDKYKKKMWGWVWAEAGAQLDLESALEIGGFGYPAMAVLNHKKMKYSILRGAFSYDGINEFLRDLSYGRGNTAPVKGAALPKLITVEPWDGQDGQPPPEEDVDLSDIDLDDLKDEL